MLRPYVTREQRTALKTAIDQRVRELAPITVGCLGCGCSYLTFTAGCKTCSDRYYGRRKRRRQAA